MNANQYGLVWLDGKQRYFREWRSLKAWKGQERIAIKIDGKEVKVSTEAIIRMPERSESDETEKAQL